MQRLIFLIICFLVLSCGEEKKQNEVEANEVFYEDVFIKSWSSIEKELPYNSNLTIDSNNTFKFNFRASLSKGFADGSWRVDSPYIILDSYPIDSCYYIMRFGYNCYIVDDSTELAEQILKTTVKDCNPKTTTKYVKFENDSFYMNMDTLFHISKTEHLCPELTDMFISKTDTIK